jgi:hypothetical protein
MVCCRPRHPVFVHLVLCICIPWVMINAKWLQDGTKQVAILSSIHLQQELRTSTRYVIVISSIYMAKLHYINWLLPLA